MVIRLLVRSESVRQMFQAQLTAALPCPPNPALDRLRHSDAEHRKGNQERFERRPMYRPTKECLDGWLIIESSSRDAQLELIRIEESARYGGVDSIHSRMPTGQCWY
jgi:hypothetical protein